MDGVEVGELENSFTIPGNPIDKFADLNFRHYCHVCKKTRVNFVHSGSNRGTPCWYLIRAGADDRKYDIMCIYCILRLAFPVEFCYRCIWASWVIEVKFENTHPYILFQPFQNKTSEFLIQSCHPKCKNSMVKGNANKMNEFALLWYKTFKEHDLIRKARKTERVYQFMMCWSRSFTHIPRDVVKIIARMIYNDISYYYKEK